MVEQSPPQESHGDCASRGEGASPFRLTLNSSSRRCSRHARYRSVKFSAIVSVIVVVPAIHDTRRGAKRARIQPNSESTRLPECLP